MAATLIDISHDLLAFLQLAEERDGDLSGEAGAALDAWFAEITADLHGKVDNYAALIRNLMLSVAAYKEEKERLEKRIKVDENIISSLKYTLKYWMERTQNPLIKTRRYVVRIQRNGGKRGVDVSVPVNKLLMKYRKTVVHADIDKIRADLLAGKKVYGCCLESQGTHIRIE